MTNNTRNVEDSTLKGLKALIVGSSGGIGFSIARSLAIAGVNLVVHGRDTKRIEARITELESLGANAQALCADLSSGIPPETLLTESRHCDILVMAYGPFLYKPLCETTAQDWQMAALGCLALPGALATEAANAMASRGFGRILLFGGTRTDAIRGFKSNAAYAAAKTGIGVLAKSIAAEFSGKGVSCSVLCPGFVDTEYMDDETRTRLEATSARGRLIPVSRIADLALALLSGGMDIANGSIIVADEGLYSL